MSDHHPAPLIGQSVLLLAAAWLVRDGHFDKTDIQSRREISLAEMLVVFESERLFEL